MIVSPQTYFTCKIVQHEHISLLIYFRIKQLVAFILNFKWKYDIEYLILTFRSIL